MKLTFEISLRNDNPPYCVVNNGLNVVVNGEKILTRKDLLFEDVDIDAKPESISYTPPQPIPNGAFILSDSPHNQLLVFSQVRRISIGCNMSDIGAAHYQ